MKRSIPLAAMSAIAMLGLSACVTVIDANDGYSWTGEGAQPFDGARDDCRARTGGGEGSTAFVRCMDDKGWTRVRD